MEKQYLFHISKDRLDYIKKYLSLNGYHAEFFGTDILVSESEVHEIETIFQDEEVKYSMEEETDSTAWKRLKKAKESADDYDLIQMVQERMCNDDMSKHISQEDLMKEMGITQEEIDAMEDVEID